MSEISSTCHCNHSHHFNNVKRFNQIKKQADTDGEKDLSLEELNSFKTKLNESGHENTPFIDKLVTNFDQLDKNENGSLSTSEIAKALARHHRVQLGIEESVTTEKKVPTTEVTAAETLIPNTEEPIVTSSSAEVPVDESPTDEVVLQSPAAETIAAESVVSEPELSIPITFQADSSTDTLPETLQPSIDLQA